MVVRCYPPNAGQSTATILPMETVIRREGTAGGGKRDGEFPTVDEGLQGVTRVLSDMTEIAGGPLVTMTMDMGGVRVLQCVRSDRDCNCRWVYRAGGSEDQ